MSSDASFDRADGMTMRRILDNRSKNTASTCGADSQHPPRARPASRAHFDTRPASALLASSCRCLVVHDDRCLRCSCSRCCGWLGLALAASGQAIVRLLDDTSQPRREHRSSRTTHIPNDIRHEAEHHQIPVVAHRQHRVAQSASPLAQQRAKQDRARLLTGTVAGYACSAPTPCLHTP